MLTVDDATPTEHAEHLRTAGATALAFQNLTISLAAAVWSPAQINAWRNLAKAEMVAIGQQGFDMTKELIAVDQIADRALKYFEAAKG